MPNSASGERSTPRLAAARGTVGAGAEDDDDVDDRKGGGASGATRLSSSSAPYGSNNPVGGGKGAALGVGAGVDRLGEAAAGDEVAVRADVGGAAVDEEAAAAAARL